MNIIQLITSYWHAAKAAGNISRSDRMAYVADRLVENHYEYIVRCFPPRMAGTEYSRKSLWLFIEDTTR
jgi:hypothetical protein